MNDETREFLRVELVKLYELGYSTEDIYNIIEYIKEKDRLLALAALEGWDYVAQYEELPLLFIEEFSDKLNWQILSNFQKLDTNIIEKYADKVDWYFIFMCQEHLPDEFLCKYKNKIRQAINKKFLNIQIKDLYSDL